MQFVLREDEVDRADYQGGKLVFDQLAGTSGPDGKVRLCGLPAGRYRILATTRLPSGNDRALRREISDVGSASFVMADRDVDGITLMPAVQGNRRRNRARRGRSWIAARADHQRPDLATIAQIRAHASRRRRIYADGAGQRPLHPPVGDAAAVAVLRARHHVYRFDRDAESALWRL
jgi:hypothetical protein